MPPKWLILLTTAAVVLPGCGTKYTVRTAASDDYGCPEAQVDVEEISDGRYRVDACGHVAIYMCEKPKAEDSDSAPGGEKKQSSKKGKPRCEEVLEEDGEMVVAVDEEQETESGKESETPEDEEEGEEGP